jgi:hypothetical protein
MELKKKHLKKPHADFTTVGVRFSGKSKVYTYRVKNSAGLKRGDLCTVESPFEGPALVFVVRVDAKPTLPDEFTVETLKWIQGKVVEL